MNNKFENENEEENSLKSASLIEHFMRTLDRYHYPVTNLVFVLYILL